MEHDEPTAMKVVRDWYDALASGDAARVQGGLADSIEWNEAEGHPYGGIYHSPEAVIESVIGPLGEEWENFEADPHRFLDCDDSIVVLGTYRGAYTETGNEVEAPFAHVIDVHDGRIQRFDQYTDTVLFHDATET